MSQFTHPEASQSRGRQLQTRAVSEGSAKIPGRMPAHDCDAAQYLDYLRAVADRMEKCVSARQALALLSEALMSLDAEARQEPASASARSRDEELALLRWLRKLYGESSSLEDFAARANSRGTGDWFVRDGRLYAPFFDGAPLFPPHARTDSDAELLAAKEYAARLFEAVFGAPVLVEMLAPDRAGDDTRLMEIARRA